MKNFYTVEIIRKDKNEKNTFIFHLDGSFVNEKIQSIGRGELKRENPEFVNIKRNYDPKVKRFSHLFTYATSIYEEIGVSIVRTNDGIWGLLHKDGTIFNNENLIEPMINNTDYEIIGFSDSGLAPFYTKEGNIAFINKNSETVAVLNIDRENEKASLLDKNYNVLKAWKFDQIYIPDECYFFGGNLCRLFEEEDFTELVNEFLEEEPSEYTFPSEIFGPKIGDEFDIDHENTKDNDIHYGNIYIIGYAYYSRFELDKYVFLHSYMERLFTKGYYFFKSKLNGLLGEPYIDGSECSVWRINKTYIILDIFYDTDKKGGDFGYQIRLYSYDEMD
ncbi:MAG: hypothetical protein FWC47_05205 [Oscillospiraceae bacterium]|nr:hypothetical protein [Oscillospiraceae bacterium]